MNCNEVRKYLHDDLDGDLSSEISLAIEYHLADCAACRTERRAFDRLLAETADLPRRIEPSTDLWAEIDARIQESQPGVSETRMEPDRPVVRPPAMRRVLLRPRWIGVGIAAVVALLVWSLWPMGTDSGPSWAVAVLDGAPRMDSEILEQAGRLREGAWLITDASARVRVDVADIGEVVLEPDSRLRLLKTGIDEHRLALDKGRISAQILAPPRLFIVETPSATAVDLGCAYTLDVDEDGGSRLHVTSGWVALEWQDREALVPAGAMCRTRPGHGPGTPYFAHASDTLKEALAAWDLDTTDAGAFETILKEARSFDTLTLWHMLIPASRAQRERLYDVMVGHVPAPEGVTRDGIVALDDTMLEQWRDYLDYVEWIHVDPYAEE